MRCEDFPCCGHELGCCPDFDEDGNQLNMKCVCGAPVPLNSHTSLCRWCLTHDEDGRPCDEGWDDEVWEEDEEWDDEGPEYDDPLSYEE